MSRGNEVMTMPGIHRMQRLCCALLACTGVVWLPLIADAVTPGVYRGVGDWIIPALETTHTVGVGLMVVTGIALIVGQVVAWGKSTADRG